MTLPYRRNVGAALFNREGKLFLARRADFTDRDIWQMPQGGIDADEDPREAVLRELREEIGTDRATILGEHPEWLSYDFPNKELGRGKHRGQTQRWFALRLDAPDYVIDLTTHGAPEFSAWRWGSLAELGTLDVAFKASVYQRLAVDFRPFEAMARGI